MGVFDIYPTDGSIPGVSVPQLNELIGKDISLDGKPSSEKTLSDQIRESSAFKEAYNIFLADSVYGSRYIAQLEMIPEAYRNADRTGFDNINWSNKADDKDMASFNDALVQIRNLVSSYYDFINTLPTEQVSQARQAGFNIAQSGDGLKASTSQTTPGTPSSSNAMESTNAFDMASNAIGVGVSVLSSITGVVNMVGSVYSSFKTVANVSRQQKLTESVFVAQTLQGLLEAGYEFVDGQDIRSIEDLNNYFNSDMSVEKPVISKRKSNFVDWFKSEFNSLPFEQYGVPGPNGSMIYDFGQVYKDLQNLEGSPLPKTKNVRQLMNRIAQYELESTCLGKMKNSLKSSYDVNYLEELDPDQHADAFNAMNKQKEKIAEYTAAENELKKQYIKDLAKQYNDANDPSTKFAVLQVLFDMDMDEQMTLELVEAVGSPFLAHLISSGAEAGLGLASDLIKIKSVKGVKGSKPKQ